MDRQTEIMTQQQPINDNIDKFQSFIDERDFPCVGAKSALEKGQITFVLADDIRTSSSDKEIVTKLQDFAHKCTTDSLFVSFIVIFQNSPSLSETEFERYLWERLQAMHDEDITKYSWDKKVSSDPDSPDFAMSIGGKAFYVVGLHPNSNRPARCFPKNALVFNLHSQFELLRETGKYAKIRETILERDKRLSGTINPMLAQHGTSPASMQYSGRVLEEGWKCPFRMRKTA
jgi:FPC/CPF motif-containing protein YcgG